MRKKIKKLLYHVFATLYSELWRSAVFILILFFNPLYSQEGFGTSPVISLQGDVKIYSTDPDFNKLFASQDNISYEIVSNEKAFIFWSKNKASGKTAAKEKKVSVKNIDPENSAKIARNIADFEHRKKLFAFCSLHDFPLSQKSPNSSDFKGNYIVPSRLHDDFSKIGISQYKYLIRLGLGHLYIRKYDYYNAGSRGFCFSEIFCVRPPPLFQS